MHVLTTECKHQTSLYLYKNTGREREVAHTHTHTHTHTHIHTHTHTHTQIYTSDLVVDIPYSSDSGAILPNGRGSQPLEM